MLCLKHNERQADNWNVLKEYIRKYSELMSQDSVEFLCKVLIFGMEQKEIIWKKCLPDCREMNVIIIIIK